MNGQYSNMKSSGSTTRSMDLSNMFSWKEENPRQGHTASESTKNAELGNGGARCDSLSGGGVLSKRCSSARKRFIVGLEEQGVGAQCSGRIYDQPMTEIDLEEEDDNPDKAGPVKKMKKKKKKKKNKIRGRKIFDSLGSDLSASCNILPSLPFSQQSVPPLQEIIHHPLS
ncbi:hypothetical protein SAY87_001279 [Trapa incisa]|uniref:Uncharacterized protein n=1 Tax=Trapa incisa TaxID=236973 RepID=A0AAN7GFX5_9MYRT|nr:hypothetical protein SAY87_001279 [Trapa incisa]